MSNITIIILFLLFLALISYAYINIRKKSKDRLNREKTDFLTEEIKLKLNKSDNRFGQKSVDSSDLIVKKPSIKTTGIVNARRAQEKPKKSANWVDAEDYDQEVSSIIKIANSPITEISSNTNTILVVDDSLVVRKYVGDLLKKNKYELIIKNDGWEALTYMNSTNFIPNLIITDIEMPVMDGIQLVESLRKERKFNHIPILVISAHAASHLKLMEEEKIQGFIRKPFEDKDLLNQTQYLLNHY